LLGASKRETSLILPLEEDAVTLGESESTAQNTSQDSRKLWTAHKGDSLKKSYV
jgi:hypothetical protein